MNFPLVLLSFGVGMPIGLTCMPLVRARALRTALSTVLLLTGVRMI